MTLFLQGFLSSCLKFIDNVPGGVVLKRSIEFVLAGLFLQVSVLVALHCSFLEVEGKFGHCLARFCWAASNFIAELFFVLVWILVNHILGLIAIAASVVAYLDCIELRELVRTFDIYSSSVRLAFGEKLFNLVNAQRPASAIGFTFPLDSPPHSLLCVSYPRLVFVFVCVFVYFPPICFLSCDFVIL